MSLPSPRYAKRGRAGFHVVTTKHGEFEVFASRVGPGTAYGEQSDVNPFWWRNTQNEKWNDAFSCVHGNFSVDTPNHQPFVDNHRGCSECGTGPYDASIWSATQGQVDETRVKLVELLHSMESP